MSATSLIDFDRTRGAAVCGTDEVGRGSLAGPIVAAGVLFDYEAIGEADLSVLRALDDSKRLSAERRSELFGEITRIARAVAVVSRSAAHIDRHGLHRTNLRCLAQSLECVATQGSISLSDGYMPLGYPGECEAVVKGDATSASIAAASIVAKVSRDRYMCTIASEHPEYGFDRHFGYSTPSHREAILQHGPSVVHRRSFASVAYEQIQFVA